MTFEPISFSDIPGVRIGNAQDTQAMTGVTVFCFPQVADAAVNVLGGGPASRESELANPERNVPGLNALVFAGGSSFGLEASHGVMQWLEEHGIGYDTGPCLVPLVCQSDIYDLSYGRADVRPDKEMGYAACADAFGSGRPVSGSVGAGTGATVGKAKGMARSQKGGIGYAAVRLGELLVGAAVVTNSYGDIYSDGRKIAGMTDESRRKFEDAAEALYELHPSDLLTGNTTVAAVFTNGRFTAAELKKIANMAAAGMARSIRPVFTMADGDTIYAVSPRTARVEADINVTGSLAADVLGSAIKDAVESGRVSEEEFLSNVHQA